MHGEIYRHHHRQIDFDQLIRASVARDVEVDSLADWMRELLETHRGELDAETLRIAAFLVTNTLIEMSARAWNDWLFEEWYSKHPERIVPLGITHLTDPVKGAEEIRMITHANAAKLYRQRRRGRARRGRGAGRAQVGTAREPRRVPRGA